MAKQKNPCANIEAKSKYKSCMKAYKKRINAETLKVGLEENKSQKWKAVKPPAKRVKKPTVPRGQKQVFSNCGATSGFGCEAKKPPAAFKIVSKPMFEFDYTTQTKPCQATTKKGKLTKRQTCPVQLHFRDGEPFLRYCTDQKKEGARGYTKKFKNIDEAQKAATKACECWFNSSKTLSKRNFDQCSVATGPLGSTRKKRRGKKRK